MRDLNLVSESRVRRHKIRGRYAVCMIFVMSVASADIEKDCDSVRQRIDDANAQFWLGQKIYVGECPGTIAEAISLMKIASESGLAVAHYNLAIMHNRYSGRFEADTYLEHLKKAAESGYLRAIFLLGGEYKLGELVRKDLSKAHALYRVAADHGHAAALVQVGTDLASGDGVPKDEIAAWKKISQGILSLMSEESTEAHQRVLASAYFNLAKLANNFESCHWMRPQLLKLASLSGHTGASEVLKTSKVIHVVPTERCTLLE